MSSLGGRALLVLTWQSLWFYDRRFHEFWSTFCTDCWSVTCFTDDWFFFFCDWWVCLLICLLLTSDLLQGSGHMVPSDKPSAAFTMFTRFIERQPYWPLTSADQLSLLLFVRTPQAAILFMIDFVFVFIFFPHCQPISIARFCVAWQPDYCCRKRNVSTSVSHLAALCGCPWKQELPSVCPLI